jgi:hypothetical protein
MTHSKTTLRLISLVLSLLGGLLFVSHLRADPPSTTAVPITATTGTAAYAFMSGTAASLTGTINGGTQVSGTVPAALNSTAAYYAEGEASFSSFFYFQGYSVSGNDGQFLESNGNGSFLTGTVPAALTSSTAGVATGAAFAPFPQGQGGEFVATWGNDSTGIRATGTDARSSLLAAAHPFSTGTAALAVAQPGDIIQFGPGIFYTGPNGWINGTVSYIWWRGAGPGQFAADSSRVIGGTIFNGEVGAVAASGTLYGERYSDFAMDDGAATSGTNTEPSSAFVLAGNSVTYGQYPIQNYSASNLNILSPAGQEGFYISSGSNGLFSNIECRGGAQEFVVKSCWNRFTNITGVNCGTGGGEFIVIKSNAPGAIYSAVHNSFDGLYITGTGSCGSGVVIDEFGPTNTYPLCCETFNDVHTSLPGGGGFYIQMSGTQYPMTGIEVSNYISDGDTLALNTYIGSGTATQPVYGNFTNCRAINGSHFATAEPLTFTNCSVDGAVTGYELVISGTDSYADLVGCSANNCGRAVQLDTSGVYLLRHPLVLTGTYGTPVFGNAGLSGLLVPPILYRFRNLMGGPTVTNTTAQTSIWYNTTYGTPFLGWGADNGTDFPPLIPRACWQQNMHFHSEGTFAVASGTNTITFRPVVAGITSLGANNNDISVTFTSGTSGTWVLDREYADTSASSQTPHTSYGNWWTTLRINGQLYSNGTTYYPWTSGSDTTFDEQVFWGSANSGNTITCTTATISVDCDPVNGY